MEKLAHRQTSPQQELAERVLARPRRRRLRSDSRIAGRPCVKRAPPTGRRRAPAKGRDSAMTGSSAPAKIHSCSWHEMHRGRRHDRRPGRAASPRCAASAPTCSTNWDWMERGKRAAAAGAPRRRNRRLPGVVAVGRRTDRRPAARRRAGVAGRCTACLHHFQCDAVSLTYLTAMLDDHAGRAHRLTGS